MRKKSLITGIIFTILNIAPTLFCAYLNSGIVYEGEGAIGLIAIIPYTFMIMPFVILFLILGLVFSIKAIKSESKKIKVTAIVFACINVVILVTSLIIAIRIIPLFFK